MPYERGNSSYGNGDFGIHIGPNGDVLLCIIPISRAKLTMLGIHHLRHHTLCHWPASVLFAKHYVRGHPEINS